MTSGLPNTFDPALDLELERFIDVPPHLVWRAYTRPEELKKWFCPRPWQTVECKIDLVPGGIFHTVMQGPEGQRHDNTGCYLVVEENSRLIWTGNLGPGFRPQDPGPMPMTAIITLQAEGTGTRYRAVVLHKDPEGRNAHEAMGFSQGWGAALDQLVALAKTW